ncbi:cupin domain-containing protein [Streptomyces olivaceoviridis]|uniref:cupin domain-containing protein n=1 Tax=Streptomyces olivaceoviridis TaxID=1921 RepID=UPI00368D8019
MLRGMKRTSAGLPDMWPSRRRPSPRSRCRRVLARHSHGRRTGRTGAPVHGGGRSGATVQPVRHEPASASGAAEDMMRHAGREFGSVLLGRIRVQIGFDTYELSEGDSVSFDWMTPHRLSDAFDACGGGLGRRRKPR